VPWRNPILGGQGAGWPKNLTTDRPYRGSNVFLLAMTAWAEGYRSPYWLTFKQASQRGGCVKKGAKSTLVVFWKQLIVEDEESNQKKKVPVLRYYRVFNIEQCEDVTPPPLEADERAESAEPFSPIEAAERIVEAFRGRGPEVRHRGHQACYIPLFDEVRIPEPDRFELSEAYYATLFHELVHSTGHSSRLARGLDSKLAAFGSPDYSREEMIAEMGAAFLCGHAGISPTTLENSAAYINGWLRKLKGDKRLVIRAAGQAQKAADLILGVEHPEMEANESA